MPVARVYRQSRGWLGLFGIKNDGENPSAVSQTVVPTIDYMRWLTEGNALEQIAETFAAVTTVGIKRGTLFTVPANEVWVCSGAFATLQCAATQMVKAGVCVLGGRTSNPLPRLQGGYDRSNVAAVVAPAGIVNFPFLNGPFLVYPGEELGINVVEINNGAASCATSLTAFVLRVPA